MYNPQERCKVQHSGVVNHLTLFKNPTLQMYTKPFRKRLTNYQKII